MQQCIELTDTKLPSALFFKKRFSLFSWDLKEVNGSKKGIIVKTNCSFLIVFTYVNKVKILIRFGSAEDERVRHMSICRSD